MDKEKAIKATKNGAIAAFISAGLTFSVVVLAIYSNADGAMALWNDPYNFIDVIIILICGYGMLRQSRAAPIVIFVYFILSRAYIVLETGKMAGIGISLIFLYFYGKAIQGAFVYHKMKKEEDPHYKAKSKLIYYVGIPVAFITLAFMGLGILTTTSVLPSTQVLAGSEMPSKDIALLTEKGVLYPDEKITYFYSAGFLSILEDGNVMTDTRLVVYVREDDGLQIYEMLFQDIATIDLIEQGDFFNDSVYEVTSFQEDAWIRLYLSTEDGGDVKFVEELRKRVEVIKEEQKKRGLEI